MAHATSMSTIKTVQPWRTSLGPWKSRVPAFGRHGGSVGHMEGVETPWSCIINRALLLAYWFGESLGDGPLNTQWIDGTPLAERARRTGQSGPSLPSRPRQLLNKCLEIRTAAHGDE